MSTDASPLLPFAQRSDYGADAHGLIHGFAFRAGQPARPLTGADEAAALLAARDDGFLWLHFNLSHGGALAWLRAHADLPEAFFDDLADGSRSTRIERDADTLFAVINDVAWDFAFEATDISTLWLSVRGDLVVSARSHPLRSVDRLRMAVRRGDAIESTVDLLDHLLHDQADELQQIVRRAADRIDEIEDDLLAGRHDTHAKELARLRRFSVRLRRMLAPEPSALLRALSSPPGWLRPADAQRLRQSNEDFALVLRDVAALQERLKLMQDETSARVAAENNRTLFTLTMVTVLALPINLVSGLFGMNVGGIPFGENDGGFWIMLAMIAGLTGAIAWLALRRVGRRRD